MLTTAKDNTSITDEVLLTEELARRPSKPADFKAESEALLHLTRHLAESPSTILQAVTDTAIDLCSAGSAGISLYTDKNGKDAFYWPSISGQWASFVGGELPRAYSPCGIVLERDAPQLFSRPDRFYDYLVPVSPMIQEVMLAPFYVGGKAVGTVWVLSHDENRLFDSEDMRRLRSLAIFASACHSVLENIDAVRESREQLSLEVKGLSGLLTLQTKLFDLDALRTVAQETIEAMIELTGADMGTMQIYNPDTKFLKYIAVHGFEGVNVDEIPEVNVEFHSTCAHALRSGKRVLVEDFVTDTQCADHRETAAWLGYRAAQSTPLVAGGEVIGMISTHFKQPHRFNSRQLRLMDMAATYTAAIIQKSRVTDQLEEADRNKSEFLAMLAHELRNPLAPIRNAVHLMRASENSGVSHAPAINEMLDRQVNQMVRLVDDLLDVSRVSRGKIELRRSRIGLADAVQSAVEAVRPQVELMNQVLTYSLPATPIVLDADPARLAQIIGNLLNNASKFSDRGGRISLTVEIVKNREADAQAIMRVKDNGIGIAPSQSGRIFDLFTQVDNSLERMQSGLGIGLTLVKNLTEMHGGSVEAISEGLGKGSEFVVCLPLPKEESASEADNSLYEWAPPASQRRILVVDDNLDAADSLAMLLEVSGHEVHIANDGQQAVDSAATLQPDVILLDIGLPRLNGYEAAQRIRQSPNGGKVMLIALTGWGQEEDRKRSTEAGFNAHLVKPVDYDELLKLIQ